jgi:deazaflavin-dependent oxidoreductase (nitroreductase family)
LTRTTSLKNMTRLRNSLLLRIFVPFHAFVFRITSGRLMNQMKGMDFCVVRTKGATSGKIRYIPLMHVPYEEGVILVASLGGSDVNPSWYWNIKANPEILVYSKEKKLNLVAEQVSDDKKTELWPLICSFYPPYDAYQKRTERNIPVFNCQPVTGGP